MIFEKLKDRDDPAVVSRLASSPGIVEDIQVINRAAWTLGNLSVVEVVPKLIPALLTHEQQVVMVSRNNVNQPAIGGHGRADVALAYNNNSIALQTPPVVSQGAVAYGMISVPSYALPYGFSLNVGAQIDNRPEPRGDVPSHIATPKILAATPRNWTGKGFWLRSRVVAALGQSRVQLHAPSRPAAFRQP